MVSFLDGAAFGPSLRSIGVPAREALDRAVAVVAQARTTLQAGGVSLTTIGNLRATLTEVRSSLRSVRDDLDATDVTAFQFRERADRDIALWAWERGLRRALIRVDAQIRIVDELAETLALGVRRKVYVVKSGDTLQMIAARQLGDWRDWPRLVEANGIAPGTLTVGTVLTIPERR